MCAPERATTQGTPLLFSSSFPKVTYVKTEEKLEKVANFIFGRNTLRPYTAA